MQSFALYGEDAIFEGLLRRLEWVTGEALGPKTYMEIGGFHPSKDSNMYHLYLNREWVGSIFEPNSAHNPNFQQLRPKDSLFNYAVASDAGEKDFYIFGKGDSSNTINAAFAKVKTNAQHTPVQSISKVLAIEFSTALHHHNRIFQTDPFFVSIDAEGEDANIIDSYDFVDVRPAFIMIEDAPAISFMPNLGIIRSLMLARHYAPVACSILTTIYMDMRTTFYDDIQKMGRYE
jgi:hypothetical protein